MKVEKVKRLNELEGENARLKKLLAEAELDKAMLKELASGNCRASSMLAFARGPCSQT
jgi:putative transposase